MTEYRCLTCRLGLGVSKKSAKSKEAAAADHLRANPTHIVEGRRVQRFRVVLKEEERR